MSRDDSLVENQLSLFRRQQIDVESDRRLRRNKEVDDLIKNIGDPRVAERLRIYRLVEEKFLDVEQQVNVLKILLIFWILDIIWMCASNKKYRFYLSL